MHCSLYCSMSSSSLLASSSSPCVLCPMPPTSQSISSLALVLAQQSTSTVYLQIHVSSFSPSAACIQLHHVNYILVDIPPDYYQAGQTLCWLAGQTLRRLVSQTWCWQAGLSCCSLVGLT